MAKILIVDNHPIFREGLAHALRKEFPQAEIAGAGDASEALERIFSKEWDLVTLDISLPGRSGLDLLKEIKREQPGMPVLVVSSHQEDQFAVRALRGGAAGYLTKTMPSEDLLCAVRKALAGGRYIQPSLAEKLADYLKVNTGELPHEALSDREFQVLRMIASGLTVKEIGAELSLSAKTISTYRSRILEKMQLRNNAELMRYALDHHLLERERAS